MEPPEEPEASPKKSFRRADGPRAPALFVDIAWASTRIARMRARLQKVRFLVDALAKVPDEEIAAAVGWLVEEPLCGPIGIGPAQLWALSQTPAPTEPTVSLREVEATLEEAKLGPRAGVPACVAGLFAKLTPPERTLFVGALTGSLRQGSLAGVMLLALVDLSGLDEEAVRRAVMVTGSTPRAANALLGPGSGGAPPSALELFHPVAPMLASPAPSLEDVFADGVERLVEWKVDGLRAQIHKRGERVRVFSRQGNDITAGCAPVLGALASMAVDSAIVDGEVVLVGPNGIARPFQETFSAIASAIGSKRETREGESLRVHLFDCMHRDGQDLLDEPLSARRQALAEFAPEALRMPALLTQTVNEASAFLRAALEAGHEGVMAKDPASNYRFGARGRAWQKIKEFTTVDLVVLAAEWGSGRRKGYLSNLHLGARREDGTFCMVGKTFKGLTDELLRWQTERFQALAADSEGHVVHVRPELVIEIRFNEVQRSRRYPGGVALRFARVVRYREDKSPSETDTLASLVARIPEGMGPERPPSARASRGKKAANNQQLSLFEK